MTTNRVNSEPCGRGPRRDRGASLVEYSLLVALIALIAMTGISYFGNSNDGSLNGSASKIGSAVGISYP